MEKKTKERVIIENQIFHLLINISEICPQYTLSQHFWHIFRKKGMSNEQYFWSEAELLKKIEDYYDELKEDLIYNKNEEKEE